MRWWCWFTLQWKLCGWCPSGHQTQHIDIYQLVFVGGGIGEVVIFYLYRSGASGCLPAILLSTSDYYRACPSICSTAWRSRCLRDVSWNKDSLTIEHIRLFADSCVFVVAAGFVISLNKFLPFGEVELLHALGASSCRLLVGGSPWALFWFLSSRSHRAGLLSLLRVVQSRADLSWWWGALFFRLFWRRSWFFGLFYWLVVGFSVFSCAILVSLFPSWG